MRGRCRLIRGLVSGAEQYSIGAFELTFDSHVMLGP